MSPHERRSEPPARLRAVPDSTGASAVHELAEPWLNVYEESGTGLRTPFEAQSRRQKTIPGRCPPRVD